MEASRQTKLAWFPEEEQTWINSILKEEWTQTEVEGGIPSFCTPEQSTLKQNQRLAEVAGACWE